MPIVSRILWDELVKVTFKIHSHGRVCIFIDGKTSGSVLYKNMEHSSIYAIDLNLIRNPICNQMEPPWVSWQRYLNLLNHASKSIDYFFHFCGMIIKDHTQLSDEDYERQFARCTFKPRLFSHEAHLRLAYIHIKKYGLTKAEENMVDQIKHFADYYGATEKFNKTVTIAAARAMNHFMEKATSDNFSDLMREFPKLSTNFKDILRQHYSFNVFSDPKAKKEFILPDLLSF